MILSRLLVFAALVAAAGCASAPEIEHPDLKIDIPENWTTGGSRTAPGGAGATDPGPAGGKLSADWWRSFGDEGLHAAILCALEHNRDILAAAARVTRAAADAKIAGADLEPTAGVGFEASRRRVNYIGFPIPGGGGVMSTTSTSYGVSLDLSWEIDLWGRLRATTRAALADLQAAEIEYSGACLSIAGQTAKAWFSAIEAGLQIKLAEETVKNFRASTNQVRSRYRSGIRCSLDVRLSLSNLANAEALLEQRRLQQDAAIRQLEILLGRYPDRTLAIPAELPAVPPPVPAGLPADLVSRRPDLAAAERRLAASDSRWEASRAALYPRIALTAGGGTASDKLGDLLDNDFRVWALAGNLTQPLFQGGRLRAGVDRSEAGVNEALAAYAGAALKAFAEVESTLAAERFLANRERCLSRAAGEAGAAEKLSTDRYSSGLDNYITVLESQRRALNSRSSHIEARRRLIENRIDLYLALGGGFRMPAPDNNGSAATDASSVDEEKEP